MPEKDNFVSETTTDTGTGDLSLASRTGYRQFSQAFSIGGTDVFWYAARNPEANEWEFGTGHLVDSTTLSRDTVIDSSNSGSLVDFTSGTKFIVSDIPAARYGITSQTNLDQFSGSNGTANQVPQTDGSSVSWTSAGQLELIETQSLSSVATADFATGIDGTFNSYIFKIIDLVPATDAVNLFLRVSNDGGANYQSDAGDYSWALSRMKAGSSIAGDSSTSATEISINGNASIGSDAGEGISGEIKMFNPASANINQLFSGNTAFIESDGVLNSTKNSGRYATSESIDAIRFLFSSGDIESGTISLYGVHG